MFSRFSLNAKMRFVFAICALMLAFVSVLSHHGMNVLSENYEHVSQVNLPKALMAEEMKNYSDKTLSLLLQINTPGNTPKERDRLQKKLRDTQGMFEKVVEGYSSQPFVENEKEAFDKVIDNWKKTVGQLDKALPLALSDKPEDEAAFGQLYQGEFKDIRLKFYETVDALIKFQKDQAGEWVKKAEANADRYSNISSVFSALGFLFSLITGFLFSHSISKALNDIASSLSQGATDVTEASSTMNTSSQSLSTAVSSQAEAVQETSAAIEELTQMASMSLENCQRSAEMSSNNNQTVLNGKNAVNDMVNSVAEVFQSNEDIVSEVEASNKKIEEISRVIQKIAEKTKVINDIVFQTKLLSFNASVEAARAGENGKGFAVVAHEVGNLARMSGTSADEISEIVATSLKQVEEIVKDTKYRINSCVDKAKTKVKLCQDSAKSCEEIFDTVVSNANQVNDLISQISKAADEQTAGIREITSAIGQINATTNQNAKVSQNVSSSAGQLSEQAGHLEEMSKHLYSTVQGQKAS
jgi:methyl-accepting chemotaxis protein